MKQHSLSVMTKRQYDSLLSYATLITHQQERNNSYVSQLQPVGRKSDSFVLPLGYIAQNNEMQNENHVFFSQTKKDKIASAEFHILKEVCF